MANEAEARVLVTTEPSRIRAFQALRRFRRVPIIPLFILVMFIVVGIGAPWIAPHDPNQHSLRNRLLPPAWLEGGDTQYLLGSWGAWSLAPWWWNRCSLGPAWASWRFNPSLAMTIPCSKA